MATTFYTQLLGRLEDHYHISVTSMDANQLTGNVSTFTYHSQ